MILFVSDLLAAGENNARTGRELADALGVALRDVSAAVERERRSGSPVCASGSGYFIAETREELQAYCEKLAHRAAELMKTHEALTEILKEVKP